MIHLNKIDKKNLRETQKKAKDKRIYVKATVLLMLDEGFATEEIALSLGIDLGTVYRYLSQFLAEPLSDYLQTHFIGKKSFLNETQLLELKEELKKRLYLNTLMIKDYIQRVFNIDYTLEGIRDLMKRLHYVYKQTRSKPSKADRGKQEEWVRQFRETEANLSAQEAILFLDAVHPLHNTRPENGWIEKGKEFEIPTNSGRSRLNINGAINVNAPSQVFAHVADTINYEANIQLFEKIMSAQPHTKFIIYSDNARYNHATVLKEWLKRHSDHLELRYLPPYSPNLNPIERLWKFMKKEVINSHYYEKFEDFKQNGTHFFENIEDFKPQLSTLINTHFNII
jgi:transposase